MKILAIAGSLREGSHNARLLREARRLAPPGIDVVAWSGLAAIPPYDPAADVEPAPHAVADLRRAIAAADAVLIATPEYNASIPGVLKNALDWASRPWPTNALRGMPVAVMGATEGSFGAIWAQADLRKVLGIIGARVIEEGLSLPFAHQAFDEAGRLTETVHRQDVVGALSALAREVAESAPVSEAA